MLKNLQILTNLVSFVYYFPVLDCLDSLLQPFTPCIVAAASITTVLGKIAALIVHFMLFLSFYSLSVYGNDQYFLTISRD